MDALGMGMKPAVKQQFFEGHSKERLARWAESAGAKQFATLTHAERAERLSRQGDYVVHAALGHLSHFTRKDLTAIAGSMQIDLAGLRSSESIEQAIRACLNGRAPQRRAATTAMITSQDLWKEAQRLSLPVLHLKAVRRPAKSQPLAAIWNKTPQGPANKRLWLMVDLRHHPDKGLRENGVLYVFDSPGESGSAVLKRDKLPGPQPGQSALYGVPAQDLPCPEIVMQKGGEAIQAWGREVNWESADPRSDAIQPLLRYEVKWEATHPSRKSNGGSVYAQLGGWPVTWPDESAGKQLQRQLVLRTYANSEPWLEVFRRGKSYDVRLRIT
jgi:hypothetical protein